MRGAQRTWAAVCSAALIAVGLIAIQAQLQLRSIERDGESWQRAHAMNGGLALRDSLNSAVYGSHGTCATAANALRLTTDTNRADEFGALKRLILSGYERGVVLFRHDSAWAWAGRIQVAVDDAPIGLDVKNTSVYLELRCTLQLGDFRATAVSLIEALPPGDRLATTLAAEVAQASDLAGFVFSAPSSGPLEADVLPYAVGADSLFDFRPVAKEQAALEEDIQERARVFAGLSLGIALFAFVIAGWRSTREIGLRLSALGVVLFAIALAPLNQFSARTRLFDPAAYYAQIGGPFTASAGALGITSAIVLLGLIAVIRRRKRGVSIALAIGTVAVVAGGPFLLGNLSRGIETPTGGVDWALWLIWEIPIFLAAVTVLLAGTAAGSVIVGRARGLHPAVAPTVAAVAGIIAPVVWSPRTEWPVWYTILWIVAVGALVVSRQTRFMILAASTVAAVGATTLVWRSTAAGRMELAAHDLSGLDTVDPTTPPHLRHFALGLAAQDSAPQTQQALMEEYVQSELEAAGHPVALSSWPTNDGPSVVLQTASFPAPPIRDIVAEARSRKTTVIDTVATDSAMVLVMAVPAQPEE